jgi:glycosyltransferase involved in cell wall biosynthesis
LRAVVAYRALKSMTHLDLRIQSTSIERDYEEIPRTITALTQGRLVPSTRFRVEQHLELLAADGLAVRHLTARHGAYPPSSWLARAAWLPATVADAAIRALNASRADLCLLQRELVSTLVTAELLIRCPLVFDVDDAIFLHPRGRVTDTIARRAALTICGNRFLAEHYGQFGQVSVLPTAVDTERFVPVSADDARPPVIGWSGSSSGFHFLGEVEPALAIVLQKHPEVMFKVVADRMPRLPLIPFERLRFERWSPQSEVRALQEFTVGLMPLTNDDVARGKCSFKMLTYMAVGLPVVVTPVGMNAEVLALGQIGYAAQSTDEWVQAITTLLRDPESAGRMGKVGRTVVEQHFSRRVIGPRLAKLLRQAIGPGKS